MESAEVAQVTPTTGDTSPATETPAPTANDAQPTNDPASQTPPTETKPEPTPKYKVKVAGEEREVGVDELRKRYELEEGARVKFEHAAQMLREAQETRESLKKDPLAALMRAGLTRDQIQALSEKVMLEQIQEERLTPEQRRIRELEAKLKSDEDAKAEADRQAQEAEVERQSQAYLKELKGKLTEAFTKHSLPPDDALLLSGVSRFLQNALATGEVVDPADAVEFVKHETYNRTAKLFDKLSGDQILEFLGKANIDKVRKADIAKLKTSKEPSATDAAPAPQPRDQASRKVKSADSFFDSI